MLTTTVRFVHLHDQSIFTSGTTIQLNDERLVNRIATLQQIGGGISVRIMTTLFDPEKDDSPDLLEQDVRRFLDLHYVQEKLIRALGKIGSNLFIADVKAHFAAHKPATILAFPILPAARARLAQRPAELGRP